MLNYVSVNTFTELPAQSNVDASPGMSLHMQTLNSKFNDVADTS